MGTTPSTHRGAWTLTATGLGLFMISLAVVIVNVRDPDSQAEFDSGEAGSSGWWRPTA